MLSRFRQIDRAIAYVCSGVDAWDPSGRVFVTWFPGGERKPFKTLVDIPQLVATLERFCRRFPEATAIVDPDHSGFPLFGLQCRCDSSIRKACSVHCRSHSDRPTICISASSQSDVSSEDEQETVLAAFQESVHRQLVEDQNRLDMHPNTRVLKR